MAWQKTFDPRQDLLSKTVDKYKKAITYFEENSSKVSDEHARKVYAISKKYGLPINEDKVKASGMAWKAGEHKMDIAKAIGVGALDELLFDMIPDSSYSDRHTAKYRKGAKVATFAGQMAMPWMWGKLGLKAPKLLQMGSKFTSQASHNLMKKAGKTLLRKNAFTHADDLAGVLAKTSDDLAGAFKGSVGKFTNSFDDIASSLKKLPKSGTVDLGKMKTSEDMLDVLRSAKKSDIAEIARLKMKGADSPTMLGELIKSRAKMISAKNAKQTSLRPWGLSQKELFQEASKDAISRMRNIVKKGIMATDDEILALAKEEAKTGVLTDGIKQINRQKSQLLKNQKRLKELRVSVGDKRTQIKVYREQVENYKKLLDVEKTKKAFISQEKRIAKLIRDNPQILQPKTFTASGNVKKSGEVKNFLDLFSEANGVKGKGALLRDISKGNKYGATQLAFRAPIWARAIAGQNRHDYTGDTMYDPVPNPAFANPGTLQGMGLPQLRGQ